MSAARWSGSGAFWVASGVVLGAFGAHALNDRLVEAEMLDNWRTAVQYHVWQGLGLVLFGLHAGARQRSGDAVAWLLFVGSVLFSGSLYALSLGAPGAVFGPMTPVGGLAITVGWVGFGIRAWRAG